MYKNVKKKSDFLKSVILTEKQKSGFMPKISNFYEKKNLTLFKTSYKNIEHFLSFLIEIK